jgi:hypothetical protein
MNILDALSAVTDGAKIRRPGWNEGDFIGKSNQGVIHIMGYGCWGRLTLMGIDSILAEDWEVYDDGKNQSLRNER